MNTASNQFVGWTAIVGGVVGVVSFVSLVLLFVVGEPFGTLNDLLAIPVAMLVTPLIIALFRLHAAEQAVLSTLAMLLGLAGFWATAIGGGLLVLDRISFAQSLLPGIGGFGLIGLWLLINSALALGAHTLPRGVAWFGLLLALAPTLALGAVLRVGNVAAMLASFGGQSAGVAPVSPLAYAFIIVGAMSYAAMPVFLIVLGRLFLSDRLGVLSALVAAS